MNRTLLVVVLLLGVFQWTCTKVPLTGRTQLKLLPESQLIAMSLAAYSDFLNENVVVNTGSQSDMVKTVGSRLSKEVESIMRTQGLSSQISGYKWEFNLVKDNLANAWAMPGGKVVIYSGILPITKDESGLAVVMGHEIAHAIARHGNERMSQTLLAQTGMTALDLALMNKPQQTRQLWLTAAGVTTQVGVLLPFSRKQESEADEMGLIFMAAAGYDPNEAVKFWSRMDAMAGAPPVPQFLSTHPSHSTRISDIKKHIPKAMKYYKPNATNSKQKK